MTASVPHDREGFSFVELIIFVALVSVLLVALVASVTASLRRMRIAEHRIYATRFAAELQEWLRIQKEADWAVFSARDTSNTGTTYCFNEDLSFSDPIWPGAGAPCTDYQGIYVMQSGQPEQAYPNIPRIFRRYAVISKANSPATQVNVQIVVEWQDGNSFFSVPLNTVYTLYTD